MANIQQLVKRVPQGVTNISPITTVRAVKSEETGYTLDEILASFNMLFLSYSVNAELTRLQVPNSFRRGGLWVTYVTYDETVVTEWYNSNDIDDNTWKSDANWRQGSNMLVGDISISSEGNWVINGVDTGSKAQGESGITPMIRVNSDNHLEVSYTNGSSYIELSDNPVFTRFRVFENKLQQSLDLGNTWSDVSDHIAAWFRWQNSTDNLGKVQISRDNNTWEDLSPDFINRMLIKGFVSELPQDAEYGDIYMVGPSYTPGDTEHNNPYYRMWVMQDTWVDAGDYNKNIYNYNYSYNIKKTYESVSLMQLDSSSPVGTNGIAIQIGEIVTVVNPSTPSENGIYSYEGSENGWKYQSSFNFSLLQQLGYDPNNTVSQDAITKYLSNFNLRNNFFTAESRVDLLPLGGIIDFSYLTIPEGYNKKLYLTYFARRNFPLTGKSAILIQIKDEDNVIVSQFYTNEVLSENLPNGLQTYVVPQIDSSGISFRVIANLDNSLYQDFAKTIQIIPKKYIDYNQSVQNIQNIQNTLTTKSSFIQPLYKFIPSTATPFPTALNGLVNLSLSKPIKSGCKLGIAYFFKSDTFTSYKRLITLYKVDSSNNRTLHTILNVQNLTVGVQEISNLITSTSDDVFENDTEIKVVVNWDLVPDSGNVIATDLNIQFSESYLSYTALYNQNIQNTIQNTTQNIKTLEYNTTYNKNQGFLFSNSPADQTLKNCIKSSWLEIKDSSVPLPEVGEFNIARNRTGNKGVVLQIAAPRSIGGSSYAIYFSWFANDAPRTGQSEILVGGYGSLLNKYTLHLIVDWDVIYEQEINPYTTIDLKHLNTYLVDTDETVKDRVNSLDGIYDSDIELLKQQVINENTPPWFESGNMTMVSNGTILDIYVDEIIESNFYLTYLRNSAISGLLIQFRDTPGDDSLSEGGGNIVYQLYKPALPLETGIKEYVIQRNYVSGQKQNKLTIRINWDSFPYPIGIGGTYLLKSNRLGINGSLMKTYATNFLYEDVDQLKREIAPLNDVPTYLNNELAINVFGDVLPSSFKEKLWKYEKDIEVVCVGDSLTGLISGGGAFPVSIASQLPPGNTHNHWTYMLWDRICKNKPLCDRLDSVRDNVEIFTKTGVWSQIVDDKFDSPVDGGEWSYSSLTYQCQDLNAKVSFVLNSDTHKKASIVFSINPDGGEGIVQVTEGNGKLIASLDKINWVEANNFTVLERNNDGKTDQQCYDEGLAMHQRHRRIWLKVVNGTSGNLNISFSRNDSDTNKFLYCWGIERWNGNSLFLTNLGRGGRTTKLLGMNISDIFDRNVDLTIYDMPLANEISIDYNTLTTNNYFKYFLSDLPGISYKVRSNNYQDVPLLCVLPHGRGSYWSGNKAIDWTHTGVPNDYLPYFKMKMVLNYLKENSSAYNGLTFVNLQDQMIQEAYAKGMTIEESLTKSLGNKYCFTVDTVHLSNKGSQIWNKYLAPIFDSFFLK